MEAQHAELGRSGARNRAGIEKLAPHEVRRSCARLCRSDPVLVPIQTTERYLGCKQKVRVAVNDRMGIEPEDVRSPRKFLKGMDRPPLGDLAWMWVGNALP